jgi:glycosyltransferase 2 family protein
MVLPALVGGAIGLVCLGFVIGRIAVQWDVVRDDVAGASAGWPVLALVLAVAGMTWVASCWRRALDLLGHRPPRRRTIAWYFAGEIAKYVPGTVWPVIGRGELARRGGVPRRRAYPSVGLSLVAWYLAAMAVASVLVPLDLAEQAESPAALALLALLPLGVGALHPAVLTRLRDLLVRLTGRGADIAIPPWRKTVTLVACYIPAWLFIWAATWCVARALLPDPPLLRIGIATTLSWTAGFVAVPVPAGAGVREAVFVASAGLPTGVGATIAVGSRLVFVLADVLGLVVTAPWHRRAVAAEPAASTGAGRDQSGSAAIDTVVTTSSRSSASGWASSASRSEAGGGET